MTKLGLVGWFLLSLTALGGCAGHTLLQVQPADDPGGSTTYLCRTTGVGPDGSILGSCAPDTTVDDARWNPSNTTHLVLAMCPNGVRRALVSDGEVLVECAAAHGNDDPIDFPSSGGDVSTEGVE